MPDLIPEPPWTVDLPRLDAEIWGGTGGRRPKHHQQLPGTAASYPRQTAGDPIRSLALGLRKRCSICGCRLRGTVYNVFTDSPEHRRGSVFPSDVYTSPIPGPMHRSCSLYSVLVCPWMTRKTSREHYSREVIKCRRGDAALVGFRKYGVSYFSEPVGDPETYLHQWGYVNRTECTTFGSSKELVPLYEEAVADDAKKMDLSSRLYWTDSPADARDLAQCEQRDRLRLMMMKAGAFTMVNGYGYRLSLL